MWEGMGFNHVQCTARHLAVHPMLFDSELDMYLRLCQLVL